MCTCAKPQPCEPPPPPPDAAPKGRGFIARALGFGLKCLLFGGLVYGTYKMGLWGDACKTENMFINTRNTILGRDCGTIQDPQERADCVSAST